MDSGDPEETREAIKLLGFLDGQTTNPSLIAKNPNAKERLEENEKFSLAELLSLYRDVVVEISGLIPDGSISVEVYADNAAKAEDMIAQARVMSRWVPNAHIKFPATAEGIKAAKQALAEGIRVNMTLCFSQEQAAAVYSATKGAKRGEVFVSPFVGRLDDQGENGVDLVENILRMYARGDGHVEVLVASIRNKEHMMRLLQLKTDIITAPLKVLREWAEHGVVLPENSYRYPLENRLRLPYNPLDLKQSWENFSLEHSLTDKGIERFCVDWNNLLA